jgi:hypothetical protein
MDGANSNKMPTFCKPQYSYNNINVRQVALDSTVTWPETKDHSKVRSAAQFFFCSRTSRTHTCRTR